ncbi:MAG: hypothetical protein LBL66_01885 [Clostridiales bacterium]|nr:hypothetical protein [Clostridiales bacterium]
MRGARNARRGNLCRTRNAALFIEIAASRVALLAMTKAAFALRAMTVSTRYLSTSN